MVESPAIVEIILAISVMIYGITFIMAYKGVK